MTSPLPLRHRAARHDANLQERLETVVPDLMQGHEIDAWVLVGREYNEDPVLRTMLPSTWLSARRRTILVFTHRGGERHAVARYGIEPFFPRSWEPETQPDQWRRVAEVLRAAGPETIGVSVSPTFALADGLSQSEHASLLAALDHEQRPRIVSAEPLAIGWLETRIPAEIEDLRFACRLAHQIVGRGLSSEAITPGVTTTTDLEWWFRDAAAAQGLAVWFHPTVSVQRRSVVDRSGFAEHPATTIIAPGDMVHVDFGIEYIGMHTDQQQLAYVLRPGEEAAPEGLVHGLRRGNLAQDLLMAEFVTGRTGNQILAATRKAAARADVDITVYTHALGMHGHAAGPTIGLWDRQEGVAGAGDYPLHPNTAYSIELAATVPVPEWGGQPVRFMLEEDAWFDGGRLELFDDRQRELWLVA